MKEIFVPGCDIPINVDDNCRVIRRKNMVGITNLSLEKFVDVGGKHHNQKIYK